MNQEIEKKLKEVNDWLAREYTGIRTGQANPGLLDSVKVESYGTLVPIQQVGSISIENARTLRISLWDTNQIKSVEKGIQEADLGISVVADSSGLRVIFPELTSDRRTQLMKLAKAKLEEARVRVKSVRDDFMKDLEKKFKAAEFGEDEKFAQKDKNQKLVEEYNSKLELLFIHKEKELQQ